ncbi:mitochondrial 54S ribosomal protein mL44 Ecym_4572 [Eremothecium cymbalariae DBVPG|uniref:Large ribosomal subunit protein mL44 n=1 Tax=Eremothecium cymbalariae (strain CBS 270.75 / DBVPG 7215 / KCTC 17166 / NRRL Y-17582) TaxID=931890 RepID=G8JS83_ERECY|nr:hypothetical protein Ecym_4572 [Eremothecium cymbalariae DBVPG\
MSQLMRAVRSLHYSGAVRQAAGSAGRITAEAAETAELANYRRYYGELRDAISKPQEEILRRSPELNTLHRRLSLPEEFGFSTLSRCLTCRSSKLPEDKTGLQFSTVPVQGSHMCDNHGLNIFGKNILSHYVTRRLIEKMPRLPTPVLNAAVDAYIGEPVLAHIGKSWGIEFERSTIMDRYLSQEPLYLTLGKLRFYNNTMKETDGIQVILKENKSPDSAMALAVRSIIGGLWASTQDFQTVYKFIEDHILSRKLDPTRLFQFEQPTRELATLCRREGLARPISKLLAESGRLSKAPVFIVGVFSGEEKLGEGFGSSLKEAKARAATDALMKWYCYEVSEQQQGTVVDPGQVIV